MALIIVAVFAGLMLIYFLVQRFSNQTDNLESGDQQAFRALEKLPTQYLFGHPLLATAEFVYLTTNGSELNLIARKLYSDTPPYPVLATIPLSAITAVAVEDHTTIEKQFSLGKFMLMGSYALAFPKNETKEAAYLVITWSVNNFSSTAVFKNDDKGAATETVANKNAILKWMDAANQAT